MLPRGRLVLSASVACVLLLSVLSCLLVSDVSGLSHTAGGRVVSSSSLASESLLETLVQGSRRSQRQFNTPKKAAPKKSVKSAGRKVVKQGAAAAPKAKIPATAAKTGAHATPSGDVREPTAAAWKTLFLTYKTKFKRKYKSPATEARAFTAFQKRYRASNARNARVKAAQKKTGRVSDVVFGADASPVGDVPEEEFRKKCLAGRPPKLNAHRPVKVGTRATRSRRKQKPSQTTAHGKQTTRKAAVPAKAKAVRFRQLDPTPAVAPSTPPPAGTKKPISSPKDIPAPRSGDNLGRALSGGDQIPKKRIGGDNLNKALGGGDQLPKKRIGGDHLDKAVGGGDQIPKKRIGGDNLDQATAGGDQLPKKRIGGDDSVSDNTGGVSLTAISPDDISFEYQRAWRTNPPMMALGLRMLYDVRGWLFPRALRNQGDCQSCWAVVAAEHYQASLLLIEPAQQLSDGNVRLSAQQILDCYRTENDRGCDGGTVVGAFEFMQTKGIVSSSSYPPLDGKSHECAQIELPAQVWIAPPSLFLAEPCLGDVCPPTTAEADLLDFWANSPYKNIKTGEPMPQPMVAYVSAANWGEYKQGIFPASECSSSGKDLTHIVQIVGFGENNRGEKFWVVRNSWGSGWGEGGHIRLPYGVNACGLFNYVIHLDARVKSNTTVDDSKLSAVVKGGSMRPAASSLFTNAAAAAAAAQLRDKEITEQTRADEAAKAAAAAAAQKKPMGMGGMGMGGLGRGMRLGGGA